VAAVVHGGRRVRLLARPPDSPKARPGNSTYQTQKEDISIRLTKRTFLNSSDIPEVKLSDQHRYRPVTALKLGAIGNLKPARAQGARSCTPNV
jgi:hypothetical protein